jgi:hypothetical protein
MQLSHSDGRLVSEITELRSAKPIGNAPVEFSAEISKEGAALLRVERAAFYRASDGSERFTLTIDSVVGLRIAGTIRRR